MTKEEMIDKLTRQYGVRIGAIINDTAGVHAKITEINSHGLYFETINLPGQYVSGIIPLHVAHEGFSKGKNSVIGYTEEEAQQTAEAAKEEMSFEDKYPHTCEYCGHRCWNGGMTYDCSNDNCPSKK